MRGRESLAAGTPGYLCEESIDIQQSQQSQSSVKVYVGIGRTSPDHAFCVVVQGVEHQTDHQAKNSSSVLSSERY